MHGFLAAGFDPEIRHVKLTNILIEAKAVRKLQHPVRSRKLEGFIDSLPGNS